MTGINHHDLPRRTSPPLPAPHDPDRLINKGDSGEAVYIDGKLIGVLWSIGEYGYGSGVNISLLRTQ